MGDEPVLETGQSERLLAVLGELAPSRVCNAALAYSVTEAHVVTLLTRSHPHFTPAQLANKLAHAINRATGSREAYGVLKDVRGSEVAWREKLRAHTINFVLKGSWQEPFDLAGYQQAKKGREGD